MAVTRNDEPLLPGKKGNREDWSNKDRTPNLPNPGQVRRQKKE